MVQDTAPSAVRIADAIDTMICATNLQVSLFVIPFTFLPFYLFMYFTATDYRTKRLFY